MDVPLVLLKTVVYSIPLLCAAYLVAGALVLRTPVRPRSLGFPLLMAAVALYSFGYFLELQCQTIDLLVAVRLAELLGALLIPAFGALFIAEWTEARLPPVVVVGLVGLSLGLWGILATNGFHGLFYRHVTLVTGEFGVAITNKGPVYYLFLAYVAAFLVGASLRLLQTLGRAQDRRRRNSCLLVLAAFQLPWVPVAMILWGGDLWFDPVPATIMAICLLFAVNGVWNDMFDSQVRRWLRLFSGIDEPAFLVGPRGELVSSNRAAEGFPWESVGSGASGEAVEFTLEGQTAWFQVYRTAYDVKKRFTSCLLIDITDQRRAEEALRSSEEKHRQLIENSHDIIYTVSAEGRFLFVSPAWTDLLGQRIDAVTGRRFDEFLHPDDIAQAQGFLDHVIASGQRQDGVEYRVRHADGSWRWHASSAVPLRDDRGRVVGFEGSARDITLQKADQERIRNLLAEKELILREVHHRIKNNMGNVMGLFALQAQTLVDPAAIAALEEASGRVQSMMVLYEKLYQAPNVLKVSARAYLSSLVDEILDNLPHQQSIVADKDIEDLDLDEKTVESLGIILNELLTNVLKYAFQGRSEGRIGVSLRPDGGVVRLVVRDDGNGIPPTVDFHHSTGFGLELLGTLTAHLGGTIRIDRSAGTSVVLEFPG